MVFRLEVGNDGDPVFDADIERELEQLVDFVFGVKDDEYVYVGSLGRVTSGDAAVQNDLVNTFRVRPVRPLRTPRTLVRASRSPACS